MAPRREKTTKGKSLQMFSDFDNDSSGDGDDYRKKRDRNNQAVKRSRVKSRLRTQETMERVQKLKTENDMLEEKIKILSKELGFLKDLFLAHASSSQNVYLDDIDLSTILSDTTSALLGDINGSSANAASSTSNNSVTYRNM